jgi:arginase
VVSRLLLPYHLDEYLADLDIPFEDAVTVGSPPVGEGVWDRLAGLYEQVAAAVAEDVRNGRVPVVASGDCTTAWGVVAGLQHAGVDPAVVWLDAHGDVQTLETTTSGYLGGMALRMLVGYRPELAGERLRLRPLPEDRVLLVDARDLDPPEAAYLAAGAIGRCSVAGLTVEALPPGPLYLHVDLDVVDPADLPGLKFPAAGGPDLGTVGAALRRVVGTGRVAALGLACTWHEGRHAADRVRPYIGPVLDALT